MGKTVLVVVLLFIIWTIISSIIFLIGLNKKRNILILAGSLLLGIGIVVVLIVLISAFMTVQTA